MATWDDFKKAIKLFEGNIPHMYLDSNGNVTVGVGDLLPNVASATSLNFVDRKTNRLATKEAIQADYASVKTQAKGKLAAHYRPFTKLDLPQAAIDNILNNQIASTQTDLAGRFADFAKYPVPAQMALTDMAFNLGNQGLVDKFPRLKKAAEAGDWTAAAAESHRSDIQASRNSQVKAWFEEAARTKP